MIFFQINLYNHLLFHCHRIISFYFSAKKEWGDGIRGLALTTAQYSLMKIEDKDTHPKNWRLDFSI